jgi:hypothetical protein
MLSLGRGSIRLVDKLLPHAGGSSLLTENHTMTTTSQLEEDIIKAYESQYDITLEAIPETVRVRGNASAWSEEEDKAYEDEILARLESGDIWAWFTAKVTVRDSHGREASDYLGCCCYEDAWDFKRGGYYLDMIRTCIDELEMAE